MGVKVTLLIIVVFVGFGVWLCTYQEDMSRRVYHLPDNTGEKIDAFVGNLKDFHPTPSRITNNNKKKPTSSLLNFLSFDKKVNSYQFTFYNWYKFKITFVDFGYTSYVRIHMYSIDNGIDQMIQYIGFQLQDAFYPQGGQINHLTNQKQRSQGINLNIQNYAFKFNVRQYTTNSSLSHEKHDGNIYGAFGYYNKNQTSNETSTNDEFKSAKTVTVFNISLKRSSMYVDANLTHVIRHNQCLSFYENDHQVLRHKCLGGYAQGKFLLDRPKKSKNKQNNHKNWVKSVYNIDNNRTRTIFNGIRSTRSLSKVLSGKSIPQTNWKWQYLEMNMVCFSKPEYYSKKDAIEKERWIGLNFGRRIDLQAYSHHINEDYLFINGKIYGVDAYYSFNEQYRMQSNITFRGQNQQFQLTFEFNFTILQVTKEHEDRLVGVRDVVTAEGYWTGWVEQSRHKYVFYNITGHIISTNSIE